MPCYDPRNERGYSNDEATAAMQRRLDHLTRLLCACTRQMLAAGHEIQNPELKLWWEEHEKFDQRRKEQAAAAAKAKPPRCGKCKSALCESYGPGNFSVQCEACNNEQAKKRRAAAAKRRAKATEVQP